ncbi:MAG: GNAT family N-acetyltransferase [Caulobacterales bacterium]
MQKPSLAKLEDAWFETAPVVFAWLAFGAGVLTILAVATPALPHVRGLDAFERLVEEFPELSASMGGVALMGLATGLLRRIDSAWAATTALFAAGCLYAFIRHNHLALAIAAGLIAVLLAASRRAFYRHSRLSDLAPSRPLALAIAAALGAGIIGALLWAGGRPGFAAAPWWALLTDPHLGRPGRSLLIGGVTFGMLLANMYVLSRGRGAPAPARDEDVARVEKIVAASPQAAPDAQLAFTGDKSFIFAGDEAFVMVARGGASLIAMGEPVGKRECWRNVLSSLRSEGERLGLRPVVYAASPEALPDLIELGFRIEKVGENALIDLKDFSLKGSAKQNLRTARRRLVEREGAAFEVRMPPYDETFWSELECVSAAWLQAHGGKEKAFSLGAFDPAYLARHPIALVRRNDSIIAFANIWLNPGKTRAAVDLMRFDPALAPNGLMDFLFTEMLLWAQAEGVETFDLGMAPLSGLPADQYASWFARLGRLVAQYGEPIYGFEGLRTFKDKFKPRWEPRYISAPGAWSLPLVLAEVAMLTNGGKSAAQGAADAS